MGSAKKALASTTCLAVGLAVAGATNAESLKELTASGASIDAGNGVTYGNFEVKIKGEGLSSDLRDYLIITLANGFMLTGDFNESGKGGRIKLSYDVTGPNLVGAMLSVDADAGGSAALNRDAGSRMAGDGRRKGKLKVKEKIWNGEKIDKLTASFEDGDTSDASEFDALTTLNVSERIKIKGEHFTLGSGSSVAHSFAVAPEPNTALMLAAGLVGIAAAKRRGSR
jgi:hypothetical protein